MFHSALAMQTEHSSDKRIPEAVMIKDIADDEILAACGDAETVALKPGETLFREGDDARAMYVVKQGTLRILSGSTILETVRVVVLVVQMALSYAHMPRTAMV